MTQIIKLIVDGTVTAGAMSGQEERDMLFARLFGLTAIIKSGMLARKGSLKTSTSSAAEISTADSFHEIIVLLVALGEKKSWLRESAWWTAGLAIDFLEGASVEWKEIAVEALLNTIFVEDKSWTPEKVALNLKLQGYYPGKDWKLLCSPLIKNGNVLAPTNLQTLAKILKVSGHKIIPPQKKNACWVTDTGLGITSRRGRHQNKNFCRYLETSDPLRLGCYP